MVDATKIGAQLAGLAWTAVRSLLGTVAIFLMVGLVSGAVGWFLLHEKTYLGLLILALAALQGLAFGLFLGVKRAPLAAITHGIQSLGLGRMVLHLVFDRMAAIAGSPGGALPRLPIGQAEEWLRRSVAELVKAPAGGGGLSGWARRAMLARLLSAVEALTLNKFRSAGDDQSIDLQRVRTELEDRADGILADRVNAILARGIRVALVGLVLLAALETTLVWWWVSRSA